MTPSISPLGRMHPILHLHAARRARQFRISIHRVCQAVLDPSHGRRPDPTHPDRIHCVTDQFIAVYAPATNTVITILLKTQYPYFHGIHHVGNLPAA